MQSAPAALAGLHSSPLFASGQGAAGRRRGLPLTPDSLSARLIVFHTCSHIHTSRKHDHAAVIAFEKPLQSVCAWRWLLDR